MKAVFLCTVLLIAGAAASSPVIEGDSVKAWAADAKLEIPEWIVDLITRLPESIQQIIDKLPEIIAQIPGILEQIPEIIETIIDKLPEIIPVIVEKLPEIIGNIIDKIPEIIPIILEKLPEIIAKIPEVLEKIKEVILQIIEKLPELIPVILEKIPEIIVALPEIYEKIREILESLDLPDWFPTLPELEKPEWWPDEVPELPEYNKATPGTAVTVEEYPGIVQIEVGTGPIWIQGCAGSVLTSVHILSAARCFSGKRFNPRFRRVRAGSSTRYTGGTIVEVNSVNNHPSFGNNVLDGDITIVRLSSNLPLGSTIQQTPIIPDGFVLPAGLVVELAGWGSTAQGKLISDRDLYKIDLTTISSESCDSRWPKVTVSDSILCVGDAQTGGRNADVRDLGAPVFYDGILVGIVSLGAPIGNQYFPVLTTSVASYTNWVVDNAV